MRNNKIKGKLVSILLAVVLSLGFLLPSFQMNKVYGASENIQTTNTGNLYDSPLESAMEEFLNQFDDYGCTINEDYLQVIVRERKYISGYTEFYETRFSYLDSEHPEFEITVTTYDKRDKKESEYNYTAQLYFDDEEDEYYVYYNDIFISLSEIIEGEDPYSRIAGVDDVAFLVASLAVAAVIICYPYVKTVVTTVITWVSSFWRWLRGMFITKYAVTTVTCYRIVVFDRELEMEKVESWDDDRYDVGNYYLAIVLGPSVYISAQGITEEEAVAILTANTDVLIEGSEHQLNTYTREQLDARNIAEQASKNNGYRGNVTEHRYHGSGKAGVYFKHYHPRPRLCTQVAA